MNDARRRPPGRRASSWRARLMGLGPALLFVLLALPALDESSATYDETEHVPAGYTYVTRGDYRLGPEHPPLVKMLSALALLGQSPTVSPAAERAFEAARRHIDAHWIFGDRFLFKDNAPAPLLWRARAVVLGLGAILILVVFQWTREAFGLPGAILAATAAALDPNLLAHGTLATTDLGFTLFFVVAVYGARRTCARLTLATVLGTGVAIAAAAASKHSAVLLLPVVVILGILRVASATPWPIGSRHTASGRGGRAALLIGILLLWGLVAWGGLWAVYGFRYAATADGKATLPIATWTSRIREIGITRDHLAAGAAVPAPAEISRQAAATRSGMAERIIGTAAEHRLVPEGYVFGLAFATAMAQVRRAFLLGEISLTGWTGYFPFAFAVKTPLATLALLALALAAIGVLLARAAANAAARARTYNRAGAAAGASRHPRAAARVPRHAGAAASASRHAGAAVEERVCWHGADVALSEALTALLPPLVVMSAAMTSSLNIGYRHTLPALPFVYVLVGLVPTTLSRLLGRRTSAVLCLAALLALTAETVAARPHFLSFFNAAAGGARGGLGLLSDSNLDWGQGLPALRRWMRDEHVARVNLVYFGTADPAAYGISFVPLAGTYRLAVPGAGTAGYAPRPPQLPGYVAISATHLQGTYLLPSERRRYEFLRQRQPDAVVADSIYIYWVERWNEAPR